VLVRHDVRGPERRLALGTLSCVSVVCCRCPRAARWWRTHTRTNTERSRKNPTTMFPVPPFTPKGPWNHDRLNPEHVGISLVVLEDIGALRATQHASVEQRKTDLASIEHCLFSTGPYRHRQVVSDERSSRGQHDHDHSVRCRWRSGCACSSSGCTHHGCHDGSKRKRDASRSIGRGTCRIAAHE